MNIYNKLLKIVIPILLLTLTGCSSANLNIFNKLTNFRCSLKPTNVLLKEDVKELDLELESLSTSSKRNTDRDIGYVFQVKSGQKLNYQVNNNTCLWIFNSENDLLNSPINKTVNNLELTENGSYVVQISPLFEFNKNLDIELDLELSKKEAVSLLKNWYQSKNTIYSPTSDVDKLINSHTTGMYKASVLKTKIVVEKNRCYYKFNQTTIKDILAFNNIAERPSIKVKIHEDYERYDTSNKSNCPQVNTPYISTNIYSYWFEKDNGQWKIYNFNLID